MIYTTCKYAPVELFEGFGEEVMRLDPNPVSFSCADGCGHPNLCGFAKAVIEEVKAKGIRNLVFTDCCDAMRRTYDVLQHEGMDFLYMLPLPHKTGEREIRILAHSLKSLAAVYGAYTGKNFEEDKAMAACLKRRGGKTDPDIDAQPRLSFRGAHGGAGLLSEVRKTFSGLEVSDETCSGPRIFVRLQEKTSGEDFYTWYARLLLTGQTSCLRMSEAEDREILSAPGVKGIVYHTIKFCDYYSFEYKDFRENTQLPLLKIETDTTPQSSGQLCTRLEAFAETLGVRAQNPQGGAKMKKNQSGAKTRYAAGVDSGSTSTDVVIMDENRNILGQVILPTGMSAAESAKKALEEALEQASLSQEDLDVIVTTGYGRASVGLEGNSVTEITCHARGANYLFPQARTIIDIGGQDSKVIRVDEKGTVENFIMNDKCAAGTGRFLEMQARALSLSMEEMSTLGLSWKKEVHISNMCTVFAESEVVSLVAKNEAVSDIIHGLNESVAAKTVSLVSRGKGQPGYCMTGGVSRNAGVVQCLGQKLREKILVSDQSQLCGAIGAALIGLEQAV